MIKHLFLIWGLLAALTAEPVLACTSAVVSGKVTPDGRPLLWKNRDTDYLRNHVAYIKGEKYNFIADVNSANFPALKEAWMGTNSVGFALMNTHSYNLVEVKDGEERGAANGRIIYRALEVCATVEDFCKTFYADSNHDHMVFPGMVYISHPTEGGTLYSKAELTALYDTCRKYGLPLFIDGARLGYGVMADGSELTIPEIARLCDVFYIGGTKVGALFGEAVVIMNPALKKDFRFIMKQRGGRMAKGRLLGIQFDALFTDDLYFRISRHADEMAYQIRDIFVSAGYPLLFDSPTNQQYPIMPDDELAELGKSFGYEYWERVDETHSGVRFCASWATTQENVDALRAAVQALKK